MVMSMPVSSTLLVLEVPGRVGRSRADDELAAIEGGAELALRRRLRGGALRAQRRGHGGAGRETEAAELEKIAAQRLVGRGVIGHRFSPFSID